MSNQALRWISAGATAILAFLVFDFFTDNNLIGMWIAVAGTVLSFISTAGYWRNPEAPRVTS